MAEHLPPNHSRRVLRAVELYATSGRAKSAQADEQRREGPYHVLVYGLSLPREMMYARINARVDEMVRNGLVGKDKGLLERGIEARPEGGAMQAIGYKEIAAALRGECTMADAVETVKRESCRYAKRQLTWLRRDKGLVGLPREDYPTEDSLLAAVLGAKP